MIRVVHQEKEHTLILKNVLHALNVTTNLIFISKLDLARWHTIFGDHKVQFLFNKTEVFMEELKNGMYLISGAFTVPVLVALTAQSLQNPANLAT